MFANRIRKNRKRLSVWVRREQVECYRLYDADMPEYAVAVDIYGDHVHVAEYKAPAGVSPDAAARRLEEVRAALPVALDIDADTADTEEDYRAVCFNNGAVPNAEATIWSGDDWVSLVLPDDTVRATYIYEAGEDDGVEGLP